MTGQRYKNSGRQHEQPILWAAPCSAWSGKARSYLIKKGVPFTELFPSHPRYMSEIMPAIGYFVMPVLELEDGTLIQDSTEIILHYEEALPTPALIPDSPLQRAVAWLVGFIGSELMSTPGLHYRWNYIDQQRAYLESAFAEIISPARTRDQQREDITPVVNQFNAWPEKLGVNPATIPTVEAAYEENLRALDDHFLHFPYLLGGRPSIADFGLMTFFFAHFARDPYPSGVMKLHGPRVYRWTERMNTAQFADGQFADIPPRYPEDDSIPESLETVLRCLLANCGPEMHGMLEVFNNWVEANPDLPPGTEINSNPDELGAHPPLENCTYEIKNTKFERLSFVDPVVHFQRVLEAVDDLDTADRSRFDALMERTGGTNLLSMTPKRRVKFDNYRYVLA